MQNLRTTQMGTTIAMIRFVFELLGGATGLVELV